MADIGSLPAVIDVPGPPTLSRYSPFSEFEFEGSEVLMRKEGNQLILTPIRKGRLLDLLASWGPLNETVPEVEDLPLQQRADL